MKTEQQITDLSRDVPVTLTAENARNIKQAGLDPETVIDDATKMLAADLVEQRLQRRQAEILAARAAQA